MASLSPMSGTLGQDRAKHLLRRGTYHITKQRIDQFAGMTASAAVDDLFILPPLQMDEPIDPTTMSKWINSGTQPESSTFTQRNAITGWWLNEAFHDPGILHKMIFFLHQNFIASFDSASPSAEAFDYLALLKHYAFGSYRVLAKKMTLDNLMLNYLNGQDNTRTNPNENYAREFLELFTIGKGPQIGPSDYTNYTEEDIVQASRLLSGWRNSNRTTPADPTYIDLETGLQTGYPDFNRHELSDKTFSPTFGNLVITAAVTESDMDRELDDFVNMVFNHTETAKTICRKLYRYFVSANITTEIETDIITPLANTLRTNDYDLEITVKQLLKSQHFYDQDVLPTGDRIIGGLIKSPLELLLPALTFFGIPIPDPNTQTLEHYTEWWRRSVTDAIFPQSSMPLFVPDSVAGYPAYYQEPDYDRNWFNASTIIARYKLPEMLITGDRILSYGDLGEGIIIDLVDWLENSGTISNPNSAQIIVQELTGYLFPQTPTAERMDYFLNDIFLEGAPAFDWTLDWIEYQSSGDSSAVRIPLENLFKALLYSQEYQIM